MGLPDPNPPNTGGNPLEPGALDVLQNQNAAYLGIYNNIGGDNPSKTFPTPRSLFYDGAKLDPTIKNVEKNGLFLFYSFGDGGGDNFLDQYHLSERPEYNRRISSIRSKNPTAGQLIEDSFKIGDIDEKTRTIKSREHHIVGGVHAPYSWKDFIYCKYYGTVPNNRMITLRRFSSPVHDSFDLPRALESADLLKKGVGAPVAQSVTWFGGKTGNTLDSLISFSTGLSWVPENIDTDKVQKAFGDKLLGTVPYEQLISLLNIAGIDKVAALLDDKKNIVGAEGTFNALNPSGDQLTKDKSYFNFASRIKSGEGGEFGILSEKIWVPVDVIKSTSKRSVGLDFEWDNLSLKFSYDLTSVGEVNTKAAMLDILGNLLSIGTNYGNFLSPHILFDSEFSALGFPGGAEGLKLYYTNFIKFVTDNATGIMLGGQEEGTNLTMGENSQIKKKFDELEKELKALQADANDGDGKLSQVSINTLQRIGKGIQSTLSEKAATDWQAPLSLYTGAAIGEWHVVIGNPYNPIAMIGNLICIGVDISFSEMLGPDDFPSTIDATITLQHARPRERGEIESIFNRGQGRLYQSVRNTSANYQTTVNLTSLGGESVPEGTGVDVKIDPKTTQQN